MYRFEHVFTCVFSISLGWGFWAPQVYMDPFHGTVSHVTGPADDPLIC